MAYIIKTRINHQIIAKQVRVIDENRNNLGILTKEEALKKATEAGLDLIEISPNTIPPVVKIMDFGKYQYEENKKLKIAKSKTHTVETKNIQIKIGTGEHDLGLKAKKVSEWLKKGSRVKVELFLSGRAKYMDFNFLKERLGRILKLITEEHKIAQGPEKGPKGLSVVVEKIKKS